MIVQQNQRAQVPETIVTGALTWRVAPPPVVQGKEQAMPGIVVGVDGSPNSERALDWAMRQAAAVHAPLAVIAVHEVAKSYWGHIPLVGRRTRPCWEHCARPLRR